MHDESLQYIAHLMRDIHNGAELILRAKVRRRSHCKPMNLFYNWGLKIEPQHASKYPSDIHRMVKDLVFFYCTRIESNAKLTSEV